MNRAGIMTQFLFVRRILFLKQPRLDPDGVQADVIACGYDVKVKQCDAAHVNAEFLRLYVRFIYWLRPPQTLAITTYFEDGLAKNDIAAVVERHRPLENGRLFVQSIAYGGVALARRVKAQTFLGRFSVDHNLLTVAGIAIFAQGPGPSLDVEFAQVGKV